MTVMTGRYRLLLWAYPRDYRRERGVEMVSTLLDAGHARPGWRVTFNLVVHGMRCRLGRPASRSVALWAVLMSVVCGLYGSALGARVGWETARPLPERAEAAAIFTSIFPEHGVTGEIYRSKAMFTIYGEPLSLDNLDTLLSFDGGEYGLGDTNTSTSLPASTGQRAIIASALERLPANGWEASEPVTSNAAECATAACDPTTLPTQTLLTARRGDNILEIHTVSDPRLGQLRLAMSLSRATPWPVHPAAILGFVIGALATWLIFGWASRRNEYRPWQRSLSTVLFGFSMFMTAMPIVFTVPYQIDHHLSETHFRWHPLWEWLGQPAFSLIVLVGLGAALPTLALALLPRPALAQSHGAVDRGH
ncbi:hypothetical protein Rhe02_29960 [Rhizocola hellebori]|uniref:Uncharacterized protein n=1 Tax=Rhizocola hellebori TaxID=1392758 RepID=A0A8J3VEZ4_9ACTN|nr:hypothetical protein [Rhizocola hellebori]GIH04929.1 hypothetical protein Rhe02_29960 [Rhizocola hellebori]